MRSRFFSVSPMYLRHDRREVDAEELEPELGGEHLRRHRLAGAGLAGEQHLQALRAGDRPLVAPVGQHAVAVAQVGRDRLQQLALALRHHEVVPAVAGRDSRGQLAQARRGRLAGAEVELVGRRCLAPVRGRRQPGHLGGLDDLADREPELGGHVAGLRRGGEVGPRLAALGERRRRRLDQQDCPVAERERGGAVGRGDDRRARRAARAPAARARARRARDPRAPRRRAAALPSRTSASRLPSRRADRGRARARPRAGVRAPSRAATRRRVRRARSAARSRGASIARHRAHGLLAARVVAGHRHEPEPRRRRELVDARTEQVGGEPVGDLDRPLGERRLRVADQPQRAESAQRRRRGRAMS